VNVPSKRFESRPGPAAQLTNYDNDGTTGVYLPGADRAFDVGQSCTHFAARKAMSNVTGGGGRWGDPFERAVAADAELGFVGPERAGSDYCVAIDPVTFVVGEAGTNRLRTGSPS
jgi:N-methylhydantoinase B/oxoprolinase/acetone carboxylase alpha subunit